MREIEIVSTTTGMHYLLIGLNNSELAGFRMQLWIHHVGTRAYDWAQSVGMGFITFMGGDLYVHNSDTAPRANFYGEQKDVKIGIVSNEEPTRVKVFDSLGIDSDSQWEIESIVIPPSLNYPDGMYSKVPKEHFKKRTGIWQAKFLRNMKTNSSTASVLDAIKGEELRGNECYMILKNVNNPTGEQVKLFKVEINATTARI